MKCVSPRFLDILNYSLCHVVNEVLGGVEAKRFFRMLGEVHYRELVKLGIIKVGEDPIAVLESIARYLESSGYVDRILVKRVSNSEVVVDMYGISVLKSSMRIVSEGKEPSHIMTNLMFAALKEFKCDVELEEVDFNSEEGHVRERWRLKWGE